MTLIFDFYSEASYTFLTKKIVWCCNMWLIFFMFNTFCLISEMQVSHYNVWKFKIFTLKFYIYYLEEYVVSQALSDKWNCTGNKLTLHQRVSYLRACHPKMETNVVNCNFIYSCLFLYVCSRIICKSDQKCFWSD